MKTLGDHLAIEDVILDLEVADKAQLFREIGIHMESIHDVPSESVVSCLMRREQAGSTALGEGVAIPHARLRDIDGVRAIYIRLTPAIAFDSPDGKPVSDVLVLMVPAPAVDTHLEILAQAASLFADDMFREVLDRCDNRTQAKHVFDHWTPDEAPLRGFRPYTAKARDSGL